MPECDGGGDCTEEPGTKNKGSFGGKVPLEEFLEGFSHIRLKVEP